MENGARASLTFRAFLKGNYTLNTSLKRVEGNPNSGAYDSMGWYACDLRTWLNDEVDNKSFINALPEVLRNNLKAIKRISDNGSYGRDLPLSVTYDKIALGSLEEFGLTNFSDVTPGQGTQYPIVTDDESRKFPEVTGVDIPTYWTRTTGNRNVHQWYFVDMDGRRATGGGANYNRIAIFLSI